MHKAGAALQPAANRAAINLPNSDDDTLTALQKLLPHRSEAVLKLVGKSFIFMTHVNISTTPVYIVEPFQGSSITYNLVAVQGAYYK